ncbi:MAG: hypothetical protein IJY74_01400, partial [Oscillospiraceae bacterium]|nr:hypothetical protein [Oscillospiraceae bacterium]
AVFGEETKIVEGATIQVIEKNGNVVEEWTSGNTAKDVVLKPGEYTLHEEAAPNGYFVASDVTFTVAEGGKITVTNAETSTGEVDENGVLTLTDDYTKVEISKVHIVDESTTKLIGGAELEIYKAEDWNTEANAPNEGAKFVEQWTSEEGKTHTINALPAGDYYLVETSSPDGYTVTEAVKFTVDGTTKEIQQVEMKDDISRINISKVDIDSTSTYVAGATMQLTSDDGKDLTGIKITDFERTDLPTVNANVITWVSSDGTDTIEMLPDGAYTLKETFAPAGYTVPVKSEFKFTITDGVIRTSDDNSDNISRDGDNITFKDKITEVQIDKKDITGENEVAGATLTITGNLTADQWGTIAAANGADTVTTGEGEAAVVNGIKWNSAVGDNADTADVNEGIKTIKGLPTAGADGELIVYTLSETSENGTTFKDGDTVYKIITTTLTFSIGTDGVVTNVTGNSTRPTEENTENADGYFFHEDANANYIEVCDAKYTTVVKISKQDINTSEEIADAHLKITDADGNVVEEWDSVEGTKHEVTLQPGEYTLEETTAPDGYVVSEEITFTVKDDGTVEEFSDNTVIMKDDFTKITINKTDENDAPMIGAKLAVFTQEKFSEIEAAYNEARENDTLDTFETSEAIVPVWETDGTGKVIEKVLPLGTYVLVELYAPTVEGVEYGISDPVTITLEAGTTTTGEGEEAVTVKNYQKNVTMQNYPKDMLTVTISKTAVFDAIEGTEGTTKLVEGATLQITGGPATMNWNNLVTDGGTPDVAEDDITLVTDSETGEAIGIQWITDGENDKTVVLEPGTYTLHEEAAPSGYLVTNDVEFVVAKDDATGETTVTVDGTEADKVVMEDGYTVVEISKVDITDDTVLLDGAELKIFDKAAYDAVKDDAEALKAFIENDDNAIRTMETVGGEV